MLWSGALGEVYLPSSAHPICLLLIGLSFACFYTLIYNGVYLPLADCRARALAIDDPQHKQRAWRYSAISAYLIVAWHGFPLLWLANQMGLGTGAQLTTGYVGTDVLAKFLPPSLYISVATAP